MFMELMNFTKNMSSPILTFDKLKKTINVKYLVNMMVLIKASIPEILST